MFNKIPWSFQSHKNNWHDNINTSAYIRKYCSLLTLTQILKLLWSQCRCVASSAGLVSRWKFRLFKALLLFYPTFSSLHQNSSQSAAASRVNISSESGGFIEIAAFFSALTASFWIEYHLLRIPKLPPVMFSRVTRNPDALHLLQRRGRGVTSDFKASYEHVRPVS